MCDDLATPRTLGPFRDMARAGGGPLAAALEAGPDRDRVLDALHRELAGRLLAEHPAALDEAERRGLLEADPAGVWFRHELARRAIERQLPPTARVACHRQVLAVLAKLKVSSRREAARAFAASPMLRGTTPGE